MQDITISVSTADQLFNDPEVNPFSESALEVRGEAGMTYLVRQSQGRWRDRQATRLVVRLPSEQITPGFESRLGEAVRRYCRAKVEDNTTAIHLMRARSGIGLIILAVVVAVLAAIVYLLLTTVLANGPQIVQVLLAFSVSLIVWVVLWDPLEALVFNPIEPMRENRALRRIIAMEIVVEPERETGGRPDTQTSAIGA